MDRELVCEMVDTMSPNRGMKESIWVCHSKHLWSFQMGDRGGGWKYWRGNLKLHNPKNSNSLC